VLRPRVPRLPSTQPRRLTADTAIAADPAAAAADPAALHVPILKKCIVLAKKLQ